MSYNDYICQKCFKSEHVLRALGKLIYRGGYLQCSDCGSDLEYESAVIIDIWHKRKKEDNTIEYPQWLKDKKDKDFKNRFKLFKEDTECAMDDTEKNNDSEPDDKKEKIIKHITTNCILCNNILNTPYTSPFCSEKCHDEFMKDTNPIQKEEKITEEQAALLKRFDDAVDKKYEEWKKCHPEVKSYSSNPTTAKLIAMSVITEDMF